MCDMITCFIIAHNARICTLPKGLLTPHLSSHSADTVVAQLYDHVIKVEHRHEVERNVSQRYAHVIKVNDPKE